MGMDKRKQHNIKCFKLLEVPANVHSFNPSHLPPPPMSTNYLETRTRSKKLYIS
ncbi:hypothetical protein BDZ94DRAFT_1064848 [Collybia nuda]|uniref:Uncharacterized protein n=1 Tax=Collybia nuda TaxID=64659 RepID=A0A9P5XWM8_9AGAR|nr:hypothetical protein BDZ94DRAFT_1064848 [Collybia nuda]